MLPFVMVVMVTMCQPPSMGVRMVLRSLLDPTTPSAHVKPSFSLSALLHHS